MGAYAKCGCVGEALKTDGGLATCVWGDSKLTLTCWIFYKNESENSALSVGSNSARCMRSIVCVSVGDGVLYRNACVLYETNYICTLWSPTVIQDCLPDLTDEAVPTLSSFCLCKVFSGKQQALLLQANYRGQIWSQTAFLRAVVFKRWTTIWFRTPDWFHPDPRTLCHFSVLQFKVSSASKQQSGSHLKRPGLFMVMIFRHYIL